MLVLHLASVFPSSQIYINVIVNDLSYEKKKKSFNRKDIDDDIDGSWCMWVMQRIFLHPISVAVSTSSDFSTICFEVLKSAVLAL